MLITIVILCFSMFSVSFSQTGIRFSYETVMDDNAFKNYENLADVIHQPQLSLFYEHTGEKGGFHLFYNGSSFLFTEFSARHYYYHSFGLTSQHWGDDGRRTLSWGLQGGQRFNKTEYQYYDYRHADGYINFRLDNQNGRIWVLGAQARYRRNAELAEFNFLETLAFIRGSFFLKSRTTVIGKLQAGYKVFTESITNEEWVETLSGTGPVGHGHGKGKNNNSGQDTLYTQVVRVESPQDAAFQLTGSLRLAQSLGSKTGFAAELTIQRNLNGGSRILSGQDSGYETNDELFDDPYSYDINDLSLELTQLLPWQSRLKIEAVIGQKKYDRLVYDLDGTAVEGLKREDKIRMIGVSFRKTVRLGNMGKSMILSLNYAYIDNDSNDILPLSFRSRLMRLGCELTF